MTEQTKVTKTSSLLLPSNNITAQPYLRYHLLLSVVLKEGVPGGPAHGWGEVESVREAIAAREQEEEEEEVGDESHHLGQADQLLVIF